MEYWYICMHAQAKFVLCGVFPRDLCLKETSSSDTKFLITRLGNEGLCVMQWL